MMDVKDIPVCGEPDCDCCKMTRRIMDAMGDTALLKTREEMAKRGVSLAKAFARTLYAHHRANGTLADRNDQAYQVEFFANLIIDLIPQLGANDRQEH